MKNIFKIIKFIMMCIVLLTACSKQNNNKETVENIPLENIEKKDLFKVVDEVESIQNKNIKQMKADAGADIIVKLDESFKLDASESIGNIIAYEWKYKDHLISNNPIMNLSIKKAGSFEMVLEVTDSNGEVSIDTVVVDVESNATDNLDESAKETTLSNDKQIIILDEESKLK